MVSFRDFVNAFRQAGLNAQQPVLVHSSLSAPGIIRGGAETVVGALLAMSAGVMVPAFTYKTMVTPEVGPEDNAMSYGSGKDHNRMAEFFHPEMPCDPLMGVLPEAVRCHPLAKRSNHPILSFAGIHVDEALEAQTLEDPLAPVGALAAQNGMVVLIGVNHQVNTAIHYAERLAGRKQFLRWALTAEGIVACPNFSGCSDGFQQAAAYLEPVTRTATVGSATIHAVQLAPMIDILATRIQQDPLALLCGKEDERCMTVRRSVAAAAANVMTGPDLERPQGEPE